MCDVAAMANAGGGYVIIGRNGPRHTSGTLTDDQVESFDPTEVNKLIHRYLSPRHECHVEPEKVDAATVVVLDVPTFESAPLIFKEVGNCGKPPCGRGPHFLPGDVFMRTKAQQSQRVMDSEEMAELINRAGRARREELLTDFQAMLNASESIEAPSERSPYEDELEHEAREFFGPLFNPWLQSLGHFDLRVQPVKYREDRVALNLTPRLIRELAFTVNRGGYFDGVPYENNLQCENFSYGARLHLRQLEWRRLEGVSLCTSGLYRLVRSFPEDFQPNAERTGAQLVMDKRELWLDTFVEQMTMLHLLAHDVALKVTGDEDEEVQFDMRVDGLSGRYLGANRMDVLDRFLMAFRSQSGTENVFYFPMRTTARALRVGAMKLARERCAKILWTFGLNDQSIMPLQRNLLGNSFDLG